MLDNLPIYSNSNISIQITKSLIEQLVTKLLDDNISKNIITQIDQDLKTFLYIITILLQYYFIISVNYFIKN